MSVVLPAVLLAACSPPTGVVAELTKPKVQPPPKQNPAEANTSDPPLSPLATQRQVVQAVRLGRHDPFAAVLTPSLINAPDQARMLGSQKGASAAAKPTPPPPPPPLDWPAGLSFDGVLQSPAASEAFVRYAPVGPNGGVIRSGSLRVGDEGSTAATSLLPPGWRVGGIDGEQGVLVLLKGGQSISRRL